MEEAIYLTTAPKNGLKALGSPLHIMHKRDYTTQKRLGSEGIIIYCHSPQKITLQLS